MHNNKLGCLTATGMFGTLITLFAVVGVAFASGSQMFSAGDLNAELGQSFGGVNSHAQITECKACHAAPWETEKMADRCASCHTDIAAQMFDVAELHGLIMKKNSTLACRDCHPEHRGATASLTDLGENKFPHEALGFSLKGHQLTVKEEAFTCKDCHPQDIKTFTSDTCDSCHRQMDVAFTPAHVLAFGTDCLACHDGVDKYGDDFNHSTFAFQANGKHADVACATCHPVARTVADLQSAPQDCFSCHQQDDKHAGKYGQDCAVCHSPDGWLPAKFDHNLAVFKLAGEHKEVACENCHKNNVFVGTPQDCFSCHQQDDEHNGNFGKDCAVCHSPDGWEPANFNHDLSVFKLEGKHADVSCESCHQNNIFKGTPQECYSCHQKDDEHNGQFGTDCAACHDSSDWDNATFDHTRSNFPLTGAHVNVACENCHQNGQFKGLDTTCLACHVEPAEHAGLFGTDCVACHSTNAWTPAAFNGKHTFPLNHGEIGAVSCATCHPSNYTTYTCYGCHEHNELNISSKHREEGIPNFENCVECHADGREHDN